MRAAILCAMRMPPDLNGHGGSQRALRLLEALLPHGDVHFVLLHRSQDYDCVNTPLDAIEPMTASVTRINIAGWQGAMRRKWGIVPGKLWDLFKMRSHEAPRLSSRELEGIAAVLPRRSFDIIFAGRVCTAVIIQSLIDRRLLFAKQRVVDFDDIMSKFRARQVATGTDMRFALKMAGRVDAAVIERAEARIAGSWNALSVCTDEDVEFLRRRYRRAKVVKVPNVVDRELLAPPRGHPEFRILFTGNLSFSANTEGLRVFVEQSWSALLDEIPSATLTVVGLNPSEQVVAMTERFGFPLHVNVPTLRPYYEECDVVIAPILFGSGTRIKILEAMAYGRPVVSTSMGAEGMGLIDGEHLLLADTMTDFARALVRLARDPELAEGLVKRARAFQQANYTPSAIRVSVAKLLEA